MSNPFRRPQAPSFASQDTPPAPADAQASAEVTVPFTTPSSADQIPTNPPVPSSKPKKVRITSPPRSPPPDPYSPTESSLVRKQLAVAHHSGPASPRTDDDSSSSEDDPFAREESSEEESAAESVHRQPITRDPTRAGTRLNPFSRTSTTTVDTPTQKERGNVGSGEGRVGAKAPMDVDSFKNLLMTGKPTASGAPASAQPKAFASLQADSSSGTDTSSVSRQSLFEPLQEPHGETPRTSYELSVSEDDDDDDRSTLIAETSKADKRKPPPPKHRHGKVVAPKGPQTVAFDDFSPTFASPSTQSLPITVSSPSPIKDSLPRTSTDLSRPLPQPPLRTSSDETRSLPVDPDLLTRRPSLPQQSSSDPLASTKRVPPAPPLARRSSLMRSNTLPHRRRSNTPTTEEASASQSMADNHHNPSTAKITPPPPPPTRRSRAGTGSMDPPPPPSVEMPESQDGRRNMATKPVHAPSRHAPHAQHWGSPPPPAPPPRRASTRSSAELGRPNASPPPGSSRPSVEMTRRSFEVEEADGETSRQEQEIDSVAKPAVDVLADMEAFQREIDELRERYGRGGV